jgi:hypothetical protein
VQAAAQRQYPRHADEILRESQVPVLRSTAPVTLPRRRIDAPIQGTAAPETSRPWDRFKPGGPVATPSEGHTETSSPSGRPSGMHSGPERFPRRQIETGPPPAVRTETARPPAVRTETVAPSAAPARIWRSPGGRGEVTRPERPRGSSPSEPSPGATRHGERRHLDDGHAEREERASPRAP